MTRAIVATLCLLISTVPLAGQMPHHVEHGPAVAPPTNLGETTFESSGSPAAQPHFLRGLLLLHSFEFRSAAAAFREAQKADGGFALGYWGEALTYNHPIWGEQDLVAARATLERLAPTAEERIAKAPTEREKGYMRAVETLYGEGSKTERDAAYSRSLQELSTRFPDDLDARAFYSLSLLGLSGTERDTANYMRAAAVAEEIYEQNKRHPGALHYLIHAYDDPVHAPLGIRAARLYASVAPAASHAQHMPSHIFFALGMWDDSIASNEASMKTARDQGMGGYHPLHWLVHGYLQKSRVDDAARLVNIVEEDVAKKPEKGARAHLAMVRATWLVETRGMGPRSMRAPVDPTGIAAPEAFVGHDLARGLAAIRDGDLAGAKAVMNELQAKIKAAHAAPKDTGTSASSWDVVTGTGLETAELMNMELEAAILYASGKKQEGIARARDAARKEDSMSFSYGPPAMVKPSHELLAELLLADGKRAEAAAEFERTLMTYPNRTLSVQGLALARAAK